MTDQQDQQAKLFNPWNPTNKDMPQEIMEKILRAYGWRGKLHTPGQLSQFPFDSCWKVVCDAKT